MSIQNKGGNPAAEGSQTHVDSPLDETKEGRRLRQSSRNPPHVSSAAFNPGNEPSADEQDNNPYYDPW